MRTNIISNLGINDYLLLTMLAICLFTDARYRRIYNCILFPFLISALFFNFYRGGYEQLLWSVKGLLLGMGILLIPFAKGGMGAGDVKLLGAIGAFKGAYFVIIVFLTGALAGGAVSFFLLLRAGLLKPFLMKYWRMIRYPGLKPELCPEDKKPAFPYALAIGCGVVFTYANIIPL